MARYCYVKSPPNLSQPKGEGRVFSFALIGLGLLILSVVFGSLGWYQWRANSRFRKKRPSVSKGLILGRAKQTESSTELTNPIFWFSASPQLPVGNSKITHYNLSVPKLDIHQAIVEIGGEDLGKSMIHYPGTSLPGQVGNAVVFCHSVLPQFFDPENYKTICSTLPTIDVGDEMVVYFDGVEYRFQITKMIEVEPTDLSVLAQDNDGEYLSLITCVPPGTYLRRLVVKARLI